MAATLPMIPHSMSAASRSNWARMGVYNSALEILLINARPVWPMGI